MDTENWGKLGAAVLTRRLELRLSQADITEAGGPSDQTLRRIERGEPGPYRDRTVVWLEKTLQWKPGAAQAILAGEDPAEWVDDSQLVEMSQVIDGELKIVKLPRTGISTHQRAGWQIHVEPPAPPPFIRQQSGIASLGTVARGAAVDVSLGRSIHDSAPASDSVTAGVRTGGPAGSVLIEPGTPEAAHFHEVLAAARAVWNLASTPATDAAKQAMIEVLTEATELARATGGNQTEPQDGD